MMWAIMEMIGEPPAITIVGSRVERAPVTATTTVGKDRIRKFSDVSLLDILDAQPGVRAVSVGGIAGGSFLSVRGGEPNFTLVTVEGIKVNDPTNSRGGAFDFNLVDPDLVESLTITRGPGSAIQGSDALSGMVDLRFATPGSQRFAASARAIASTGGETGASASASTGWASGGLVAAAGVYDSGSLDEGSDLDRQQAFAKLRQGAGTFNVDLFGLHAWTRRAVFPEDSGGPLLAVNRKLERGTTRLNAASLNVARDPSANIRPTFLLSFSRQEDDSKSPFIAPGMLGGVPASENHSRFDRLEAVGSVAFDARPLSLSLGVALLREDGRNRGTLDFGFPLPTSFALRRTTKSAFAEASIRPSPQLLINLAGRLDKIAGVRASTTGRVAARWQSKPAGWAVFGSIGQGYKQPSFFALGHPLIGNPNLRPEQSTNAEAGVSVPVQDGRIELTAFRQRFRDLVDFDPVRFRLVNRSRVTSSGLELEFSWRPAPSWELSGSATYLHVESEAQLRNRPHLTASGRATWQVSPHLGLSAQVKANSSFFDSSIPTGLVVTRGHAEADIAARYDVGPVSFDVALRNIFDSRAQSAVGFPQAGRLVRASLRARY